MRRRRSESQRRQTRGATVEGVDDDDVISQSRLRQSRRRRTEHRDGSPTSGEKLVGSSYVRSTSAGSIRAKRRSVQMLTVVVILFFVCWTPMYVMQTWSVFDYEDAVAHVSPPTMNYIHLLAFVSSCCNPITYCFMSAKFRQGFVDAFRCRGRNNRQLGRSRVDSAQQSVRHHEMATTKSIMMMTTRVHRATTTSSACNEHDVVVSHQL